MTAEDQSRVPDELGCGSELLSELRTLYDELGLEVSRLGPVCELSGRCCRFREYGHSLFVSTLEIQLLLKEAPEPQRTLDRGEMPVARPTRAA